MNCKLLPTIIEYVVWALSLLFNKKEGVEEQFPKVVGNSHEKLWNHLNRRELRDFRSTKYLAYSLTQIQKRWHCIFIMDRGFKTHLHNFINLWVIYARRCRIQIRPRLVRTSLNCQIRPRLVGPIWTPKHSDITE